MAQGTMSFPELETLTIQISELAHNWGFKRIHGRIWAQLFLSERPLDAADLISQLDISKALVSISIRELLEVKAVEDVGRSQRGTHLYRANADVNAIALEVVRKREKVLLESAKKALEALKMSEQNALLSHEVSATQIDALSLKLNAAEALLNAFSGNSGSSVASKVGSADPGADSQMSAGVSTEKREVTFLPNGSSSLPFSSPLFGAPSARASND